MTLLHLFHNQGKGKPVGGARIRYLLNDSFNDTLAAGSVNGTAATPGPGTRSVADSGSNVNVSSGNLNIVAGNNTYNGNYIRYQSIARAAGKIGAIEFTANSATKNFRLGFVDTVDATPDTNAAIQMNIAGSINLAFLSQLVVGSYSADTSYILAFVLRSTGAYHFIKGGSYTNWTLLWPSSTGNTATLELFLTAYEVAASCSSSYLRVTPLAYDTFTDSNGTSLDAHSSDSTGPDSQGCTSRSWTEQNSSSWTIESNKADPGAGGTIESFNTATMDVGEADVIIDTTLPDSYNATSVTCGIIGRYSDDSNHWQCGQENTVDDLRINEINAGVKTQRATGNITVAHPCTIRAILDGTNIDVFYNGADKISYASASLNQTATVHGINARNLNGPNHDNFTVFARDSGYSKLDSYTS
jgi:hypothetical protein